jgi:DNA-binding LacI/PurR family transcriptional regulator
VPTIYDIANAVGTTAATVSNALNGKGKVSASKRARIIETARKMGYRPNLLARSLTQQRSHTIALVVPHIANAFYAEFAESVEITAQSSGIRTVFVNTNEDDQFCKILLDDLIARRVDGILLLPGGISVETVQSAAMTGTPIVCCLWEEEENVVTPSVGIDFIAGGRLVAQHFLELGHRRVGVVLDGKPDEKPHHHLRFQGFLEAISASGICIDPAHVQFGDSSAESGKKAANMLLQGAELPTAIFATNDLMALGALASIWESGRSVPGDISVAGFDDISLTAIAHPSLTTVRIDQAQLVEAALSMLFQLIDGKQVEIAHPPLIVPTFIPRASTGPYSITSL